MAKEWVLNQAMNRFQFNFKRNVGVTSEEIRKCQPKNIEEWEKYYYHNVYPKKHIESLGRKLFIKITEVITAEIEEVTEEDCIEYMINMVIKRTYDGYLDEKETIYGTLKQAIYNAGLDNKIEPAPDEWDRKFNVDFYVKVNDKYIGIQIKPVTFNQLPDKHKWQDIHEKSAEKFEHKFGGKVFYVFSIKKNNKKIIYNKGVIEEIIMAIKNLK